MILVLVAGGAGCSDDDNGEKDAAVSDGGGGGDGSTPVKPVSMDELIDACLRMSACGVRTYPTLGNCVEAYFTLYRPQGVSAVYDKIFHCVNAAKGDCTATAKCYGKRGDCDNTYKARCEGTVAVSCDLIEKKIYAIDCGVAGLKCGVKQNQSSTASCTPDTCTNTGNTCDGDKLLSCSGGIYDVHDCKVDQLICGTPKGGNPACISDSGSWCDHKLYTNSCKGTKAVTCENSLERYYDCSKDKNIATACSGASCDVAGTECTSKALNRCAGDQLEACLDGKWFKYDCKKLGLGGCKTQSIPSGTTANCSKP